MPIDTEIDEQQDLHITSDASEGVSSSEDSDMAEAEFVILTEQSDMAEFVILTEQNVVDLQLRDSHFDLSAGLSVAGSMLSEGAAVGVEIIHDAAVIAAPVIRDAALTSANIVRNMALTAYPHFRRGAAASAILALQAVEVTSAVVHSLAKKTAQELARI